MNAGREDRRTAVIFLVMLLFTGFLSGLAAWITGLQEKHGANLDGDLQARRALARAGKFLELSSRLDEAVVLIPAGPFVRGSTAFRSDERPQQRITLQAFLIDRFEVTNVQYRRFLRVSGQQPPAYWDGLDFPAGQADFPVVGVSWEQVQAYCRWAGRRLPTEAEWEKACRGVDGRLYPWGMDWKPDWANLDPFPGQNQEGKPVTGQAANLLEEAWQLLKAGPQPAVRRGLQPVGSYPQGASPFGVQDLAGNASEWVLDWYNFADYSGLPDKNPLSTAPEWNHVLRGSAWFDPNGSAEWQRDQSRCAARNSSHTPFDPRVGFRCAQTVR